MVGRTNIDNSEARQNVIQNLESSLDIPTSSESKTTTRKGRQVKNPARYCRTLSSFPEELASQEWGSCREVTQAMDGGT